MNRRFPVGAEVLDEGTHFRVWAPKRKKVEVVIESGHAMELAREGGGYFSGLAAGVGAGALYRCRLDSGDAFPDPISRFQPKGPHGASEVVDPSRFAWSDQSWKGVVLEGQVVYEIHIGTFTREGPGRQRRKRLPELADVGITVVELMPVADFPGTFGWGYDGVGLFAPSRFTAGPTISAASSTRRTALGSASSSTWSTTTSAPTAITSTQFSDDYFTDRYKNEWGEAINYDGENCRAGARVGRHQCRVLGRGIPPRRPASGRDAADLRRLAGEHP